MPVLEGDALGYWSRNIIEDYHDGLLEKFPSLAAQLHNCEEGIAPQLPRLSSEGYDSPTVATVGILGAGVGGLYTALILDSLDIRYEILEASDRTGGRLFTYKFPNGNKYDYYDVGAMRYPLPAKDSGGNYKAGVMKRLGDLINYSKLNDSGFDIPLNTRITDYYVEARAGGTFLYFNSERYQAFDGTTPPDFYACGMGVEPNYVSVGIGNIVGDVIDPFIRMIMKDLEQHTREGWDIMKKNDAFSLRTYMSLKYIPSPSLELPLVHLPTNVVDWCETLDSSTGSYDRSLTEQVFDFLSFGQCGSQTYGEVEWKSFDGGSQVLTDCMTKYITQQGIGFIEFNKSIASISQVDTTGMEVSVRGESKPRTYSHVISSIPLPGLRMIDLSRAGLSVMQSTALRKLQYGPLVKIGMRFKSAWWTEKFGIVGGQSYTDLPIRTIVYPSYGVDSGTPSTVLIASYCWTNDAERLGSLINTGKTEYTDQLKDLVLCNLAEVHNLTYDFLLSQYEDMHAWDWGHDPLAIGGCAFFGPGDFQDLYASLTVPNANKRLHFAGEAISTRHSWVVGALDSAWRAVYEYLLASGQPNAKIEKFFELWGKDVEWAQPSSKYADRESDMKQNTLLQVHLGYAYLNCPGTV